MVDRIREEVLSRNRPHLTFNRIVRELAAENSKQLDYIEEIRFVNTDRYVAYLAQWKDGVTGQARALIKYAPRGYDIGEFYHMSGWQGTHPEHN